MRSIFILAATATVLACSGAVSASTYSLGTLDGTIGQSNIQIEGRFDDTFNFTTGPHQSAVNGSMIGIDVFGDLSMRFRFGEGTLPTWGTWSQLSAVPSDADTGAFVLAHTRDGLRPGNRYWFQLQGTASQSAYSITLAPVPEPEAYAMLLAGLGLMGTIARRRKNTDQLRKIA